MHKAHGNFVRLAGELDIAVTDTVAASLCTALRQLPSDTTELTVDLQEVTFMDASAVGVLVKAKTAAGQAGVTLRLANVPTRARRVLGLTNLETAFDPLTPAAHLV